MVIRGAWNSRYDQSVVSMRTKLLYSLDRQSRQGALRLSPPHFGIHPHGEFGHKAHKCACLHEVWWKICWTWLYGLGFDHNVRYHGGAKWQRQIESFVPQLKKKLIGKDLQRSKTLESSYQRKHIVHVLFSWQLTEWQLLMLALTPLFRSWSFLWAACIGSADVCSVENTRLSPCLVCELAFS